MLDQVQSLPLVRDLRASLLRRRFERCLQDGVAEEFLELLLGVLAAALLVDPALRRHAQGPEARYGFRSADGRISAGATLAHGLLRVSERPPAAPHVTVVFRDGRALMRSLLSAEPDLLGALLRQDVSFEGNLNYVYRLAFVARRLQRSILHPA